MSDGFDGWALDPGTLGFHLPWAGYAHIAAQAGFGWVEVSAAEVRTAEGVRNVQDVCARAGVQPGVFSCPWQGSPNGSVPDEEFRRRLTALPAVLDNIVAAGGTRVSAFFNSNRPGMARLSFDALAERCALLAAHTAEYGLTFCAEINDPELLRGAAELVTRTAPGTTLLVDTFHLFRAGLGPDWVSALPVGAIGWVHVSGVPAAVQADADSGPRCAPFRGRQKLRPLLKAVLRTGYRGPLSIEVLPAPDGGDLTEYARDLLAGGVAGLATESGRSAILDVAGRHDRQPRLEPTAG